jgi:hypothetical protein
VAAYLLAKEPQALAIGPATWFTRMRVLSCVAEARLALETPPAGCLESHLALIPSSAPRVQRRSRFRLFQNRVLGRCC